MSTGANCGFTEKTKGRWFYRIQRYPYGETEDYDEFGPFPHFKAAHDHLGANHANPGGYSIGALPGCPHDMLEPQQDFGRSPQYTHFCNRCGGHVDRRSSEQKEAEEQKARWENNSVQFPRLLAEIRGVGLTVKQEKALCASMDLTPRDIYVLLERADKEWERIKERHVAEQRKA